MADLTDEAREALLKEIAKQASGSSAAMLRDLAEAFALAVNPSDAKTRVRMIN